MTGATMNAAGLAMQQLEPFLTELRPELHRYCSRLLGSVIEGEDLVQDVMIRAMGAAEAADQPGNLRAWAFKVAHNRAIDLLRSRGLRHTEPIDVALDVEDLLEPDPLETVLREEAVRIALARFLELPVNQRSVVILKDILDEPIAGIAEMLGLTTDSVKAHLARGRAVLKRAAEHPELPPARPATSPEVAPLRRPFQRPRVGRSAELAGPGCQIESIASSAAGRCQSGRTIFHVLFPEGAGEPSARVDGRARGDLVRNNPIALPDYFMWLEWRDGTISFIHDYRYATYLMSTVQAAATDLMADCQ